MVKSKVVCTLLVAAIALGTLSPVAGVNAMDVTGKIEFK